jgi:hypothetical protein
MKTICFLLLLFLMSLLPDSAQASRPGSVSFSDGTLLEGDLSLTPGYDLTLHDAAKPLTVPLEAVTEIRFMPEREEMVKAWRFPEAGQATKKEWGDPYPMRHLEAELVLKNGESWKGHLHTLPLYVTVTGTTRKILILAKQRGAPGETLQSLTYPLAIRFQDGQSASNRTATLMLAPDSEPGTALCAMTRGSLVRLPGRREEKAGPYTIDSPLGAPVFVALQKGDTLTAAWKSEAEPEVVTNVLQAVKDARDFFDLRTVAGLYHDKAKDDVYALVTLVRSGQTTLGGDRTQPWRLEVWRFKWEPESKKLMLAARNWFFRGITEPDKLRQPVVVNESLTWKVNP